MGPPSLRFRDASLKLSSVNDSSLEIDCLILVSSTTSCSRSLLLSLLICSLSVLVVSSSLLVLGTILRHSTSRTPFLGTIPRHFYQ